MEIYLIILAAVLLLGRVLPQEGPKRKQYIVLMALLHAFVCGFRYQHLTGDLMKYHWEFNATAEAGWLPDGRNVGFYLLMRLVYHLTDGNFQIFLLLIAVVTQAAAACVIDRYSPAPWLSYLVLNCMGFYIFGFSAVRQALAMAFVMLSFIGIAERKPGWFLGMMTIAGLVHLPSLIFLPAYPLVHFRVSREMLAAYILGGILLHIFKEPIVDFMRGLYYDDGTEFAYSGSLGGRFFLILLITGAGALLRGFESRQFAALFHLMAVSALLQMLSGFDNVFTRLTDYYFQFSVLYIPMIFYGKQRSAILPFNGQSRKMFAAMVSLCLIWFYYTTNLNVDIAYAVDDYTNFRFAWDVQ